MTHSSASSTDASTGKKHVVVIGGGPAAHRFTEAMTARGLSGHRITVLTEARIVDGVVVVPAEAGR